MPKQHENASGQLGSHMKSQKEIFKASEADAWFNRNKGSYVFDEPQKNEVIELLKKIAFLPGAVLEIGCSNGFRLNQLREEFDCKCLGIDPSPEAILDGSTRFPQVSLNLGTADCLPFKDDSFDTIIFGFCLYLCDEERSFQDCL